jgi:RecB family exonuclease
MSTEFPSRIEVSNDAATRLRIAADWIEAYPADAELTILAHSVESASDLLLRNLTSRNALFGLKKFTLNGLAHRIAQNALAATSSAPASALSFTAVVARAVHQLNAEEKLKYFAPVATKPGFPVAVARTLEELRMNRVEPEVLEGLKRGGEDLAAIARAVEKELLRSKLLDRAKIFQTAVGSIGSPDGAHFIGQPLLLLDVSICTRLEIELIRALAAKSASVLATVPHGDAQTIASLERAFERESNHHVGSAPGDSLSFAKRHLFHETSPPPRPRDTTLTIQNWPGEPRECVEIVRSIQKEAESGVPFDEIAVLLNSPAEYRAHLEEAFSRAAIPAYFARGSTAPDPAGRAMLALLSCAADGLSVRAFAEYLSLGQVPNPEAGVNVDEKWVPPRDDLMAAANEEEKEDGEEDVDDDPETNSVVAGTLRVPSRWEKLLVESSVIGKKERWEKRLEGLANELKLRIEESQPEEEARVESIKRQLFDLESLREFALPLIERLANLPTKANWAAWLNQLRELAVAALREPSGVMATLAELEPMGPVSPIDLHEVQLVLTPRLRELSVARPLRRYGCVFVGPVELARGLAFRIVYIPGLAERVFPKKIVEDAILPDEERRTTGVGTLTLRRDRLERERLALRIAIGCASDRAYLSYPRVDVQQSRPRVPSFYALEALRAAEGVLPGFESMAARAESKTRARLGWPAPELAADAIDEAEYDLATLAALADAGNSTDATGGAHYLLSSNPHLARALRGRSRRWLRRWTPNDGLVDVDDLARLAMQPHQFSARAFSATALQNFAACPYRFYLSAILRLVLREEPAPLEVLDPLTRGSLFHETQFEVLTALRRERLLPLVPERLERAFELVGHALDEVANEYKDKLAPAIERVWDDGISAIRADLREWLRRSAYSRDPWIPDKFELSFGLADRDERNSDPASVAAPVEIIGDLKLRGAIDLIERHPDGRYRVTDHKTGKARAERGTVVGGGKHLQPLLYALACEKLLKRDVVAGRLYYCTSDGNFEERVVPLDEIGRRTITEVLTTIRESLADAFLPAAPEEGACTWCDFLGLCGAHEELRTRSKPQFRLVQLTKIRELR